MGIDTLKIARKVHKDFESKSLGALCDYYHIENPAAHRAYYDALATAKLYQTLAHYLSHRIRKCSSLFNFNIKLKSAACHTKADCTLRTSDGTERTDT